MSQTQVAIYARVSSEQQAEAGTIASQLAALQQQVAHDGLQLNNGVIIRECQLNPESAFR
jgi:site-specific DNA recombinase